MSTYFRTRQVVDFETWYQIDGLTYLFIKAKAKAEKNLREACEKEKFPFEKLSKDKLNQMAETVQDNKKKDALLTKIEKYFSLLSQKPDEFKPSNDSVTTLLENLSKNQIAGFHLIENWEKKDNYKIVLLRDLKRISYNIAKKIGQGLEEKSITETWKNDLNYSLSKDLFYEVVAEMQSPYVELLMERFSLNFCRVGVEDFEPNIASTLFKKIAKDE